MLRDGGVYTHVRTHDFGASHIVGVVLIDPHVAIPTLRNREILNMASQYL